ncbi:hypothetical protein GJQ55_10735 [Venatoribacter cucullus]|uniref:Uncharacterized protein n=1 Tax=Venatoribacter cucullus TaxID=2661630 RepID=A0A9X7YPN3_9GAMM|nr:hypothetical protein [Venatoribacter cucullus]QQD24916.1 hypothetical protein GJQ55_10735 [Venatoribacter cucullus]
MPVLQEQKPALHPNARGGIPLPTPLARVPAGYSLRSPFGPAFGCYSRWSFPRLPNPIEHTRPRGIHAPTRSFGIIQTMLLALENFGLKRMGRNNFSGYAGMVLLSALCAQNQKPKTKNQKPKTKNQKPKTKNQKKISGHRPPKKIQVAAVLPGPFGPARR